MNYIIKKNGRRYNSKRFDNYEQARSYIRKKLRSDASIASPFDYGWFDYNNPSHSRYGFKIQKV